MIDIYVCEDNPSQLNIIKSCIENTILIEELDMKIALSTDNPHQILDALDSTKNIGLFFLDIDLKTDIDGLSLAQKIRKLQPRCFIIFITSHSEMGFLTFQYKVEALDFIIKTNAKQIHSKIHECLLDVAEKHASLKNSVNKTFSIAINDRRIVIDYNDIIFFTTSSNIHKVILHGKNRIIEFGAQLKEVEQQLDAHFYRCHRSCIINLSQIAEVDFEHATVTMNNGEVCPVSTRAKKNLKKRLNI